MESEGLTLAVDAAETGQGRSTSECGHSSCEQTAEEILPVNIIVQGEMFHQPGRILSEESQGSVESDRLSTLDPLIHNDMPASPPQNHPVYLWEPGREGDVSFEEAIRRLNESQPEKLAFQFIEVDRCDEAYKEHRHQFIDAVSTCQSLKELTIEGWEQKLSIEEVQLLCQNLLPALNSLTLYGLFDYDIAEIVCEKMANNCVLKNLSLALFGKGRMSSAGASLGSMLAINSTLDDLDLLSTDLGPNGVEALLQPLTGHATARPLNKSLAGLVIGGRKIPMGQGDGEAIAHMLRTNDTLTHFSIHTGNGLKPSDVCKIFESLQKNQTLLSLSLELCRAVKGPDVSAKMMDLFRMNRSLTNIDLSRTPLEQSDVCKILESLQKNQTLRSLNLSGCNGVEGPDVLAKMMDLVRMHPCLMEINLFGTPLEREGQAAQVQAQLENNAKDYMAVLRGMPRVPPKFVRVFLCGNSYSGKTTLGRSMKRAFASGCGPNLFLPLVEVVEVHKPFKFCSNDPDEWSKRTRGIKINVLLDHPNQKISLWDLAGQEEYHAFHDMMMPDLSSQGNVSFFILVCNPFDRKSGARKSRETVKEELRSWLRFISSNTKRSFNFPPHIIIVITNADKGLLMHKELVESDVRELANQFRDYINLSLELHSINAHSSRKAKDVVDDVTTTCTNVLDKLPPVFRAFVNVQHGLSDWIKEHPYQPIVAMETFKNDIVAKKEPGLQPMSPTVTHNKNLNPHEAVALFLHDAGEIIYFKDEDFVVVNPHWFCHQVMGHLIKLRRHVEKSQLTTTIRDGMITVSEVEYLLKNSLKNATHWVGMEEINVYRNLIQLMINMDLAYIVDHQGDHLADLHPNDTLFVPTTLEDEPTVARGERRLQWSVKFPKEAICIYIGRRLQCRDEDVTTLTPGFFPRIQVVLKRHFANLRMGAICENEKDLMKICGNGFEIFVELSGNEMHGHAFIDILVKSSKNEIQTIQLVHDHVLSPIEQLCSSPQGCQGVTLMKGVLRPRVVEKLLLCKNRTKQVALVEDLKMKLLEANIDLTFLHTWPQVDVQRDDDDFLDKSMEDEVASLLGKVATHDVLERHLQGLKDMEIDINKLPSAEQASEHTQGETFERGDLQLQRSSHQMSLQEPTNLEQLIRDIMRVELRSSEERIVGRISTKLEEVFAKTNQEIECMEKWLYEKLSKKLDGMTELCFQLHHQQVPCSAFFTTGGTKQQRRLVDKFMGIETVYLHFLCEDIDGIHIMHDQKGDEIRFVGNENRHKIAHLVIVGFKIVLTLSKVAAHVVGGVGNLVPDFAQGLALAYDAQDITNCIKDPRIHRRAVLGQNNTSHLPTARNALVEDHKVATQWLVDLLRGKDIFNLFGLSRVRYLKMDSSHGDFSTIRWVCWHHRTKGLENGTLKDCPA